MACYGLIYEILRWREHWQKHLPRYPTKNARSRSHAFWVTNDETFVKKLFSAITDAPTRKSRKKQQLHRQLQSFLHYTQTQKLPALIMIYQIYFRCQPLRWQYFFLWCPTKNELDCKLLFLFTVITVYRTEGENVGDWLRFLNSFIKRFWPVVLNFFIYFCNDNEKEKHLKFVGTHFLISNVSKVSENLKIMKNIVRIMTFKKMLEQN